MPVTPRLVAILLASTSLAACNNTEQRAENAAAAVESAADATGNRLENAADATMAAVTPTPTTADFVNTAAKSDAFEIAAAKLAAKNAASPEVKAFATGMITAHTASTAQIKAAAVKASPAVTPNAALTAAQNEDLADLGKLTGAKFDEEYIEGQVDAHEDALRLMKAYAGDGADAGLKAAAAQIAPAVEGHLGKARALKDKIDK